MATTKQPEGTFCWADLGTGSRTGASAFYAGILGWEPKDAHLPEGITYTLMRVAGADAAGIYELDPEQRQQRVSPHWLIYIAVDDAEAKTEQAKQLGAKVVMDAYDVLDLGRMAILLDPTGALFALWEGKQRSGMAATFGSRGALAWCELMTPSFAKTEAFYGALCGWQLTPVESKETRYTELTRGGHSIAGVMEIGGAFAHVPAHWVPYFAVPDCEAAAAATTSAGGRVLMPPTTVADGDTYAVLRDPQSAVFGVVAADG